MTLDLWKLSMLGLSTAQSDRGKTGLKIGESRYTPLEYLILSVGSYYYKQSDSAWKRALCQKKFTGKFEPSGT